uniref:Alpha-amylase n=1 Tax=Phaedon cochleariae TaxID=80249 RepID=AMY_PHACE|nr:RecName: Full=Alpha-amylase; AltName: Full=1,4-alpha-D-glucan glucanohydrolase; Flags: Precursor [Phaedon cochleariae]CAA76926.1 alpha-amylase [Phaedon cochleariae]
MFLTSVLILCSLAALSLGQKNNNFAPGRNTIVHLFEWHWDDIANECENFLGPKGFAGVQISPPAENTVIGDRPWWERYQPISYALNTRSGDESALASMIRRCNNAGVRIYVDAVFNHMSATSGIGTGGSSCDVEPSASPAVPYGSGDFHGRCTSNNYQDPNNIRNCWLSGLPDLDQSKDYVRDKILEYLNHLVDLGVAGFRVDAAKHMWPADLQVIYGRVKDLNTDHGFSQGSRPFFYQEVIDLGGEGVSKNEYTGFGTVLEFKYGTELGNAFQGNNALHNLENWGPAWGLLEGTDAVVFIDNHDNQRTGSGAILTYKNPRPYKMAIGFMLAHPYGTTRIMSSFSFDYNDQGPPTQGPGFNSVRNLHQWVGGANTGWRQILRVMVGFRNAVDGTSISNWWSDGNQQIAFGRGDKGFVAFTLAGDINGNLQTSLPAGSYCDIVSGKLENGSCTGKTVNVDGNGQAYITLSSGEDDGFLAIHVGAKV